MQLTLNIKDENKVNFVLELIKSFDYIDIIQEELSPEQKKEIDRRLKLIENGETNFHSWEDVKKEINAIL